jgi:multicomponent Na+:H+ antiporter subunit D
MHEAPFLCVLPPVLTALGCVVLFFFAGDLYELLQGIELR